MEDKIRVEVAYGLAHQQHLYTLDVAQGTTARQAVLQSGILNDYPEANVVNGAIGIFGKVVRDDTVLRPDDRVEVYRPLVVDAKDARRRRVKNNKEDK